MNGIDMDDDHLERLSDAMDDLRGDVTTTTEPRWPTVTDALLQSLLQPEPRDFDLPHVEREEC